MKKRRKEKKGKKEKRRKKKKGKEKREERSLLLTIRISTKTNNAPSEVRRTFEMKKITRKLNITISTSRADTGVGISLIFHLLFTLFNSDISIFFLIFSTPASPGLKKQKKIWNFFFQKGHLARQTATLFFDPGSAGVELNITQHYSSLLNISRRRHWF